MDKILLSWPHYDGSCGDQGEHRPAMRVHLVNFSNTTNGSSPFKFQG